jgi:hypothetical protein
MPKPDIEERTVRWGDKAVTERYRRRGRDARDMTIGVLVALLIIFAFTVAFTLGTEAGADAAIEQCNAGVTVDSAISGSVD